MFYKIKKYFQNYSLKKGVKFFIRGLVIVPAYVFITVIIGAPILVKLFEIEDPSLWACVGVGSIVAIFVVLILWAFDML